MSRPIVFITRNIPSQGIDMLKERVDLHVWEDRLPPPREAILREIAAAEALISLVTDTIDGEVMDAAPNLKVISNMAVGYDNIRVQAATDRGLPVGNTPGVLTETSADLTFALLMSAARRLSEAEQYIKAGQWDTWEPTTLLGRDIYGATLGIIGLGRIGQSVARRAKGFAMRVLYHGGSDEAAARELGAEKVTLDELLEQSDFVSLHVPLNADTHHLISEREFALMKTTAILINTARGGVVDPKALYQALTTGSLAAAALDVTEPEPIEKDSPLLKLENCLIVPHIGSASIATRQKMAVIAAKNVLAGLSGERLPHCVNPEVYD